MAEGARLESVFRGNSNVGSNPTLSASQSACQRIFLWVAPKPLKSAQNRGIRAAVRPKKFAWVAESPRKGAIFSKDRVSSPVFTFGDRLLFTGNEGAADMWESIQADSSSLTWHRRSNRRASSAGIAQQEDQAHGKRPTAVRGCVPAPEFAGLAQWQCRELVPLRRVFDSLDQLQISMAGLAEWLRHWIVAPVTRVRFSHLAPMGGSYKGITHGLHP